MPCGVTTRFSLLRPSCRRAARPARCCEAGEGGQLALHAWCVLNMQCLCCAAPQDCRYTHAGEEGWRKDHHHVRSACGHQLQRCGSVAAVRCLICCQPRLGRACMGTSWRGSGGWRVKECLSNVASKPCRLPLTPTLSIVDTATAVTDRTPISANCLSAASPEAARPFQAVYSGQPQVGRAVHALVVGQHRSYAPCGRSHQRAFDTAALSRYIATLACHVLLSCLQSCPPSC